MGLKVHLRQKPIFTLSRRTYDPAANQGRLRISERTKAGLERTRANGTKLGRPKIHTFNVGEAKRLRGEGKSWNEIIKELGLPAEARGSVVRAVNTGHHGKEYS